MAAASQQGVSGQIWPDNNGVHINAHGGGVLFHDGLYYWFGEHKIAGPEGNLAYVGVHCYSSTNLHDWKDEGIALNVVNDCLLYTSPSPRDRTRYRMPSSA